MYIGRIPHVISSGMFGLNKDWRYPRFLRQEGGDDNPVVQDTAVVNRQHCEVVLGAGHEALSTQTPSSMSEEVLRIR